MDTIIKVENLSKSYVISHEGQQSYTALRDVIANKTKSIFSFSNQIINKEKKRKEIFWALKDINFEIKTGDRVGIIGRNGAGKSTLLKILSRITEPSNGKIKMKGRVASLLEVGTGFHPELTGRENIFLNGAILGMNRTEVRKHFEAIVDFAEIEKFLDTPVKRYSSGMYVRLAFAVAAHLEPEILIVDEVLAVGDAQFQKKCLGKMEDVSKNSGRTVLFVSHNTAAIQNLCEKCLLLNKGEILQFDKTQNVLENYLNLGINRTSLMWKSVSNDKSNDFLKIKRIVVKKNQDYSIDIFVNSEILIEIETEFFIDCTGIAFEMLVKTPDGMVIFSSFSKMTEIRKGNTFVCCKIPKNFLNNTFYSITIGVSKNYTFFIEKIEDAVSFEVLNFVEDLDWFGSFPGVVRPKINWIIK